MSEQLVVAPMLVVLVTAVLTLGLREWPNAQIAASVAGVLGYAASVGVLAWRFVLAPGAPGAMAYQVAGWPAPFGITLVADGLSAFMLSMIAVVSVASLVFSTRYVGPADQRAFYYPFFFFLLLGVTGAFLTGDLFNLFVWFEVLLMSSYVFVAFVGEARHTRAALRYVVMNFIASSVMLVAIGGLYATTGTLNMADMSRRLANPEAFGVHVEPVVGLSVLLLVVFALKAGLVPFQFWVPSAYQAAPFPVTAMLAGATKKVGIYAIIRLYFTVLASAELSISLPLPGVAGNSPLAFLGPLLLLMGAASILLGGYGALSADTIEGVLAYSSIGQAGFIAIPVAIAAVAPTPALQQLAILAALVYALNHALSKGLLFLAAAAVRHATGTSRLADLGGLAGRTPVLSGAVFVGLLSLVGIPPLSGFFGKLLVFRTVAGTDAFALVAVLAGSILTIAYTTRAWSQGIWGSASPAVEHATTDAVQVAVLVGLAALIVAVGVGFEPVYQFADAAATAAVDRGAYVDAVDPVGGGIE
ncbi:complex I subunit 5 family protein [Halalkalicoccus ordinarius]|uniref:complex I subunit 5 family protein n=1 Tax=Halalkalicoccus ordinarius TaxID=3116651 RepID=UPI00300EB814